MYPMFVFAVLLVNSLQSGKTWQACAQQIDKSHSHTNSAVSRQVYVQALLVLHLWSVFFQQMVIHRFYRAEEDNQNNLFKLFE